MLDLNFVGSLGLYLFPCRINCNGLCKTLYILVKVYTHYIIHTHINICPCTFVAVYTEEGRSIVNYRVPVDLLILLDSSASVGSKNFNKATQVLEVSHLRARVWFTEFMIFCTSLLSIQGWRYRCYLKLLDSNSFSKIEISIYGL